MKKHLVKSAFSLVELSIVILIVGVIITGVTQGSRVITAMRLSLARSLTNNSEVNNIPDLVLWLEPTLPESFRKVESDDGKQITQWYDINPSVQNKKILNAHASNMITYKRYGINNLPTVYFNGSDGEVEDSALQTTAVLTESNYFTIFIVAQNLVLGTDQAAFINGLNTVNGYGYMIDDNSNRMFFLGGVGSNTSTTSAVTTMPEIIFLADSGTGITYQVNGVTQEVSTPVYTVITPSATAPLTVGSTSEATFVWNGYISEIIFFGRVLKPSEISDVKKYLSKKYNIKAA